ncbi:hypothetical protein DNK06_19495 [Pseudomonas daroniae]|uniref:Uncharacterized protein n=1 Tax=Phytopseudomonas daroniae TaxID=2487519 RepID=A0A4Q9QHK5_9GAMM|nr:MULTISPECIES: ankyrin repeat domain-containing protein [Pseudomonas]TBU74352.1 hypothetical protein DNK06_19495 [Pseudomonas daroniae]TBU76003.1 hypothetical protein DNK10_08450 [Pseudomonas daroniae]TBU85464.1 hypothetical protein DNK31_03760 [Pseudomonas sp. FRB 228]TBU94312.1 hypothetical protein DNJ99_03760 [Pseudomonas daroniae]
MKKARSVLYGLSALVIVAAAGGSYLLATQSMEQLVECGTEDSDALVPSLCVSYLKLFRLDAVSISELQAGAGLDGVLNSQGDNRYQVAELLLQNGLDVDGVNHYGVEGGEHLTPLQAAIYYNDRQRIEFLLRHGADASVRDSQGRDALALVGHLSAEHPGEDRSALLALFKR